ncbi:MAG: esterase family protein [Chitinophagaceae bacterium]|nr:esterase family protein [Chitinophagaceae bacterium]
MKKVQLILLFVFTIVIGSFAQGFVKEKQVFKSAILNKEVHYSIFLPSDYYTSERAYPVTYLLHGYGDEDDGWIQFGEVNRLADDAIKAGKIPPMIIVTPDGFTSFYINTADGKLNYEDFFIKELIPHIEKTYKVKAERKYRGIAGLSMGGYGALMYALKYPNLFAAAAPLSAAVWTDNDIINLDEGMFNGLFGNSMGKNLKGKDRLTTAWLSNSPLAIIEKKSKEELSAVRYWIDCGDDDFLTIGNAQLHIALTNKNVPHEFRMRDGAHNWTYWRTGIIDALAFIGDSFHQK